MVVQIQLMKPTILIPSNSIDEVFFYISCQDEEYDIQLFDTPKQFKYGVLPTESQQDEWIKQIIEYLYKNTEKKVSEAK
jgi:hypothetical protein